MSKGRAVLLVVEGDRAERRLMRRALEVYGIADTEVFSYGQNVYDLYRRMFQDIEDVEDLDLIQVLKEKEHDPQKRKLLDRYYTDIILIFDYDPQDHLYSAAKLQEMASYFNESTDHGKLYINYPMVEAYRDLVAIPYDSTFVGRVTHRRELVDKSYKESVMARSKVPQLAECDVGVFNQILLQNIEKACILVGCGYDRSNPTGNYNLLAQRAILAAQSKTYDLEGVVSVLCTCLWFVIDYRPVRMARFLRSFAS